MGLRAHPSHNMRKQATANENAETANVVQTDSAGLAKTSQAYWLKKVKIPAGRVHYGIQIAHLGRRQFFSLHTAEAKAAAIKAQRIWLDVIALGWDGATAKHRPEIVKAKKAATVGALIESAARHSPVRAITFHEYAKALRRLAMGITEAKEKGTPDERRERADAIRLDKLTPAALSAFKIRFLREAETASEKEARGTTINSLVRNSAALLKKKGEVRRHVAAEIELPAELWFDGYGRADEGARNYESKMDAGTILAAARIELDAEALKALLLTLCLGLRRSEADALLWEQFDFEKGVLDIRDTDAIKLKSKGSVGKLALDDELKTFFLAYYAKRKSAFVIEPPMAPRATKRKGREYRCRTIFDGLVIWLRSKGVEGRRPIHTMRKEVGAVLATEQGIYAASRFLRHSGIQITSQIYADHKAPISSGLGRFLAPPPPPPPPPGNVIKGEFKAAQGAAKRKGRAAL